MSNTYRLIDSGNFEKLEQVGPYRIIRPSPQAVWKPGQQKLWGKVDAHFRRFAGGDGKWTIESPAMKKPWVIEYGGLNLQIEITDFGHLGLFPEQRMNWQRIRNLCSDGTRDDEEFHVLNLFAYTGGSSLAAAQGGATVAHVDASKTSVAWARLNADVNNLTQAPIRWLTDDVQKFVAREIRRNRLYKGIILDPPSFGRGTNGETWKIEEHLIELLDALKGILHPDFSFFLLSSHSTGYTPIAMQNLLGSLLKGVKGRFIAEEMLVDEEGTGRSLPSGASTWFVRDQI
ncbi:MAG: class I SAM-dependent methyltransferase [Chitinophagaceae bacterium]|nr:class I SAM-dependent methyltransferase [Oligoflexus sp.]